MPDEPIFVLLGRDPAAPDTIEEWANLRARLIRHGEKPESDWPMNFEARRSAALMREWRRTNWPAARDRQTDAAEAPLAERVSTLLRDCAGGLAQRAAYLIGEKDFEGIYRLLTEALETGARTQRGDHG